MIRSASLRVLAGYLVFAIASGAWRIAQGSGSVGVLIVNVGLLAILVGVWRSTRPVALLVGDWLPLLALPVLYFGIPLTIMYGDGRVFDPTIQAWDRALFGTDPARAFAGAVPSGALSEVLHASYLSYYLIIYGPPLLMYLRGGRGAFAGTVLAFTVAMVGCFVVFSVFPVEGPRYAWPAPAGVPDGPFRSLALALLERGSSRGTAFPSSHLAIALAIGLSSMRWNRRLGVPVLALATLLGFGAVYGGFHYAVDMAAGAVVGAVGWGVGRWAAGLEAGKAAPG